MYSQQFRFQSGIQPSMKTLQPSCKKTFVIKHLKLQSEKESALFSKEYENLFFDPKTYLSLPNESSKKYIVGRKITGPRYDEDDQVIPYSIVGNPKLFRKNKLNTNISKTGVTFSTATRASVGLKQGLDNTQKNQNSITDKDLHNIFTRCKDRIESNGDKMDEYMKSVPLYTNCNSFQALELQEKNLNLFNSNRKLENKIENKIYNQIYRKYRKSIEKLKCENLNDINNKTDYGTKPSFKYKKLLMKSIDSFRMKKITKEFNEQNENVFNKYGSRNLWLLNLRKGKNFTGVSDNIINIGNSKHPVYCQIREKFPHIQETVINPDLTFTYKDRLNTESLDKLKKTSNNLANYMNKTINLINLEVKGKSLLKAEIENSKLIKGKKKLFPLKYNKDLTKELDFAENWK